MGRFARAKAGRWVGCLLMAGLAAGAEGRAADGYVKGDLVARAWLDGDGPAGVLEPQDQWRRK